MPGLSVKPTTLQSDCFVFSGGEVITFNDEISCRCPIELPPDFEGAVPADPILKILKDMPEEDLELRVHKGQLAIIGKGRILELIKQEEINLNLDLIEPPEPKDWKKLPPEFGEAVRMVEGCAGKGVLDFVNVHPKWLEATNTYQAARYKLETNLPEATLVKRANLAHVAVLGMSRVCLTENWIHFKNPNKLVFSCRRWSSQWDEVSRNISMSLKPSDKHVVIAMPKWMRDAAKRAEKVLNNDDKYIHVELAKGYGLIRGVGAVAKYRERKKVGYAGKQLDFTIPPELFGELIERHNEFMLDTEQEALRVTLGSYRYVTTLGKAGVNGEEGHDQEAD